MKKIALLIEDMHEDIELLWPLYRLKEAGFQVDLIGSEKNTVYKGKHGVPTKSDLASSEIDANDYEAVVIPGGYSPDKMRACEATKKFVKDMNDQDKIVAAVCHGPWMIASTCDIKGKDITSYPTIKDDLINAGANYIDEEVVVSGNIITSRNPDDLIAFTSKIIEKMK
ncbi:MAG: type 1 glutamine amidotransferase domain-containing protein [Senegalia sp. (in: firmicutes)]|uniref:type 1 glutamine amidotransferase domain-containing protein n=1 Tax=Senegalia sp. (in: firmicutes) TaxID=1924098 RepID=UPI003F9B0F3D